MNFARKLLFSSLLAVLSVGAVGCFRSPQVRMHKYYDSGLQYFQKGKYAEAALQFQNAIQIDKNFADAHYQLARCFAQQGLWPNAYREFQVTVDLAPQNLPAQIDLATLLFGARRFEDVKARVAEILSQNPNELTAQLLLASSEAELGDLPAALKDAQKGIDIAPAKSSPYLTLALMQERNKQISTAEKTFRKAAEVEPTSLGAHLALGGYYQRQRRWADAEAEYRRGIELSPTSVKARASLASLFIASGQKDRAEHVLEETKRALPNDPTAYPLLGDYYAAQGQLPQALAEFSLIAKDHPKDVNARKRHAELLISNNNLDEALKVDEAILRENPKDGQALVLKGRVLNLQKRSAEAVPVLELAVRNNSEDAVGHFELGVAYGATKNLEGSEKELLAAVKLRPAFLGAYDKLAVLALGKKDMALLEQCASAWLQYAPTAYQGYLMRGTVRITRGDISGAESDLQQTIHLQTGNALAYARLADVRVLQRRFPEAEKLYENALTLDPSLSEALKNIASVMIIQKEPDKALKRVQEQIEKVPGNSSFRLLLAQILLVRHEMEPAQAALQKAIDLDSGNRAARFLLANVQQQTGHADQAETGYDSLIRDDPKDVRPYISLGLLEESRSNWQRAEDLYKKALDLQADEPTAANNLSYLLLEHGGDSNYALSLAQIARKGMPESPSTADTLAWAYYQKGIYNSAIELLEGATKKMPENATYHYHLALAYQRESKVALARQNFQQALAIDPQSARAGEIRKALADLN